jgi:hypothetical protein
MNNQITYTLTAAAVTSLALAACGGGEGATSSRSDQERFQEAALKHAECMRRQGIDVPDPKPGQGVLLNGADVSPDRVMQAQEACDEELGELPAPELSARDQREFRDAALKHARCMRRNGIEMPDPTFGADGGARIELEDAPPLDDPRFKAAQQKCREHLAGPAGAFGAGR